METLLGGVFSLGLAIISGKKAWTEIRKGVKEIMTKTK